MRHIYLILVFSSAAATACADHTVPGAPGPEAAPTPVTELIRLSAEETQQRFTVTGKLVNAGTNFFTDRRLVLVDEASDTTIAVRAWLPMEAYPAQDPDQPQPETMAKYLGKTVQLVVTPTRAPVKGQGIVPVLEVYSAHIVDEK